MAKFPEPPPPHELARVAPGTGHLPAGSLLWRIYFRGGDHPGVWNHLRSFGPVDSARFDHHEPPPGVQARAILYAAIDGNTCFGEVFQVGRSVDRRLREPWLVAFETVRDLELLDLTGTWPTRAGASMAINTGPRPRAQRWARAIYAAYPTLHGIYYASSMDANQPALALFERARLALPSHPVFHRALADPPMLTLVANAAARFDYRVI